MKLRTLLLAVTSSLLTIVGCSDAPADRSALVTEVEQGAAPHRVAALQEFRLKLFHLHTGESLDVAYRIGDRTLPGGVHMLNHLLRDWRTGEDAHYPIEEFDLLHALMARLHRTGGLIQIVCGYRSPQTNRLLRAGTPRTGVAENSEHMLSQAIDLRIPGVSTARVRDAALSLAMGGVGYYPRSGFVHVDVGPVRQWTFGLTRRIHQPLPQRHLGHPGHRAG